MCLDRHRIIYLKIKVSTFIFSILSHPLMNVLAVHSALMKIFLMVLVKVLVKVLVTVSEMDVNYFGLNMKNFESFDPFQVSVFYGEL